MSSPNRVKEALEAGKTVIGPFMKLTDPAAVEIIGHAGFDFVIIDAEHGPISMESTQNMVRAAQCVGITPIIRVRDNDPTLILRALDIGAGGVEVPQINKKAAAEALVSAAKFAPEGSRGVCRFVRAARYSARPREAYFKGANVETITIAHLEGIEAIENMEGILSVDGLDVAFIGPYDLSQSMGIPGKVQDPAVVSKMEEVVQAAKRLGKVVGTFVDDVPTAKRWLAAGVQYISFSVDVGIFYDACARAVAELRS
ncbi:MAG: HpcH/HpaI aldolase/citrate lyase family protein [Candidatus Bipolaricaulia bacterium]